MIDRQKNLWQCKLMSIYFLSVKLATALLASLAGVYLQFFPRESWEIYMKKVEIKAQLPDILQKNYLLPF